MRLRSAVIALLCMAGCRQILGLDSPVVGEPTSDGPPIRDATFDSPDAPATSGPMFVQGSSAYDDNGTEVMTTLAGETPGDLLLVEIAWLDPSITATLTDSDNNSYEALVPVTDGTNAELAVFIAPDLAPSGTPNRFTVTLSAATTAAIVVAEYRGLAATAPVVNMVEAHGASRNANSGPLLAISGDLLVGVLSSTAMMTAGAGFTQRVVSVDGLHMIEDRLAGANASYSATASGGGVASTWLIELIELRPGP